VWRNASGTTYDVDFDDPHSLLDYVQYSAWTGSGETGTEVISWTSIATGINDSSYSTDWQFHRSAQIPMPVATMSCISAGY